MGIITIAIVTTFTALLQSAISISPVIFLKLAEDQTSEEDLIVTAEPSAASATFTLNYTAMLAAHDMLTTSNPDYTNDPRGIQFETIEPVRLVRGLAPRWPLPAYARKTPPLGEPSAIAPPLVTTFALALDSEQEESIGLGRAWNRRALGRSECYASKSVLQQTGMLVLLACMRLYESLDSMYMSVFHCRCSWRRWRTA